ncbi:YdbC family protein [Alkalihalobacillus pseudalcaliphilus]|uniref:YdbC family protein n=1 Tax=Alkalihalobacillus pseudalcaliphilus TaxID=79884 RepID=UPI00064D7B28|nr:PC4/YdbC family ssDNA-binding protein [Alkalihalobacillus pseudalcaliphilus]KMK76177.1 seryl-tRNA synthetase [Alkalihalobacillus pseudalcaliphilus]
MTEFKYDIIKSIGTISESPKGWKRELNWISWNGRDPKYDIRDWSPDHVKMGKGMTFTKEELLELKKLLTSSD